MQKHPPLYIPIETKNREFDAKLFLSCIAAERGYPVFLGNQKVLLKCFETFPRGIIMDKRGSFDKIPRYGHYKQLGFQLTAHDEEGFVTWNWDEYQRSRQFSDAVFAPLEYFFAWGLVQAEFVASKTAQYPHKIIPVGHPRIDMTRQELRGFYQDEAHALRDQYGRFILINTNFALWNHFYGERGLISAKQVHDEQLREFYLKIGEHQKQLFGYFVELIKRLRREFPAIAVILRPHPSENQDVWKQALPDDGQTFVIHQGNVLPWLMAAEVMIHNSCTTGVESYLLGEPVIAYRPISDQSLENELPNLLSDQEVAPDGMVARIRRYLEQGQQASGDRAVAERKAEAARRYVTGLDGRFAAERIVDALDQIGRPDLTLSVLAHRWYAQIKYVGIRLRPHKRATSSPDEKGVQYRLHKFAGVSLDEVQRAIAKFQELTGRFAHIHASPVRQDLFRVMQRDDD